MRLRMLEIQAHMFENDEDGALVRAVADMVALWYSNNHPDCYEGEITGLYEAVIAMIVEVVEYESDRWLRHEPVEELWEISPLPLTGAIVKVVW